MTTLVAGQCLILTRLNTIEQQLGLNVIKTVYSLVVISPAGCKHPITHQVYHCLRAAYLGHLTLI